MVQTIKVSLDEAASITIMDNVHGISRFKRDNIYQVYDVCNTWLLLGQGMGVPMERLLIFKGALLACGLCTCVSTASALAEELLEGLGAAELPEPDRIGKWARTHLTNRDASLPLATIADYFCESLSDETEICRCILQFFLYPERFTYVDALVSEEAFEKFFRVNAKCRDIYYSWPHSRNSSGVDTPDPAFEWPGPTILLFLKRELAEIFVPEYWDFDPLDRVFSAGSTSDSGRDYADKWVTVSQYYPGYKGLRDCSLPVRDTYKPLPENVPNLLAVPKSMSARRIIAPESAIANWNSSTVLGSLRRMNIRTGTSKFINEEDQQVNQSLALSGSLSGYWATIDMSAASDSISKAVFFRCIPSEFSYVYQCIASSWCSYTVGQEVRRRKLYTLLTSGNRATWLTEAMWFLAIARLGAHLCGMSNAHECCFAYGDDLIVPAECYETVCELLEALGHTVNRRKSYGSGVFRESCGGWYHRGTCITPLFWPRRVVTRKDRAEVLCHLQRKLFAYEPVRRFCEDEVLRLCQDMTYSPYGEECDDLWSQDIHPLYSDGMRHWHPRVDQMSHKRTQLIEAVTYYEYLEYGPLYQDGLLELLGVSSSRLDRYNIS